MQNTETKNLSTNEPDISAQQPREEAKRVETWEKAQGEEGNKRKKKIERPKKQRKTREKKS